MATLNATPSADTTLVQADTNNYDTFGLNFGWSGGNYTHVLIRFDISAIAAGSTVSAASLTIKADGNGAGTTVTFKAHRMKRAWVEAQADDTEYSDGNAWQAAGGTGANDYESTGASTEIVADCSLNDCVFDDAAFIALVQDAVDNRSGVLDLLLKGNVESGGTLLFVQAYDSEDATEGNRPALAVTYTAPAPEMAVSGNGQTISDGDSSPSTDDDTDFGSVTVNTTHDHIFTIANAGTGELTLDGDPIVAISGDAEFTVTSQPSSPVAASGSTTFTIRFAPTEAGMKSATVSIDNDDSDEDPYTFDVQGTGVEAPSGPTQREKIIALAMSQELYKWPVR